MNQIAEHPFTAEQFKVLTAEQRQAIEAVGEYLAETGLSDETYASDEEISSTFNLLKSSEDCVPGEEAGEDLLNRIRKKFCAIYEIGMELAEKELKQKGTKDFSFCIVIEPSFEDSTHVAILDYKKPVCYLHEWTTAWNLGFVTLTGLANAVLQVKKQVIEKVIQFVRKDIFILVEGGIVHEVVGLPPNINVIVIDYDTDGVEKERLEISPVDGELCTINKW